ncbi:type VII secretion-associated protein (TIGR03931 family) [Halopolyspora algeriensis]|uniref:Type VII secretion-associated protein (TIGR03931 family) n=1 Tax=Halopolyspora algeriensis TaxID=1500506 RepID=A0A368VXM7_9ACTN|nr:type VII secretion-associated protein [Halopolyspora algeriensis]RCW46737.1 type VII secretion-associated protein (TIGR03931 family) [Halopolyspora algeriensis]TQM46762.1 type VII secretion-associated protein (TIGR03931 family) [Halopolyspora algeriensis]
MTLHVSVDFGTSSTCTAVSVDGGEPHVVVIDGQPLVPSAVFAAADGTVFVGQEAERQAAVDPSRFEPHPKRRIDEGELLLGGSVLHVGAVIRAVLQRVVGEARRYAGGAVVDLLVLSHPADWGSLRTGRLHRAASGLARGLAVVPEPVGAAVFHSAGHGLPDGSALAVLDLGGGTVDASVVHKQGPTFRVSASRGEPNFGGADIDQMLLEHIGDTVSSTDPQGWRRLVEGREMADRRRRRVLRQDVRGAKETLSRHSYTDVPLPPPFSDAHVTRSDLERLIAEPLGRVVDLLVATLREGQVALGQLAGVFLVGGSSRVPLVSRLIHERIGVVPTTLDQPETVVCRGALRAARTEAGTGGTGPHGAPAVAGRSDVTSGDSLSRASTIVIGGSDRTRPVMTAPPRRRARLPWVFAGVAGVVVAGVVAAVMLAGGGADEARAQVRHVARYGYEFEYPADWKQGGGDPELWETRVSPRDGGQGSVVSVRKGEFDYNVEEQRERSVRDLRRRYDGQVAAGRPFSGFEAHARFAGRDVVHYRQQRQATAVDWYVLHEGTARISVGCQYPPAKKKTVLSACAGIVRTLSLR